jgi:predicted 3-demethylubiquinone-9 3-methyltransferase (glyoxalase superfamily)
MKTLHALFLFVAASLGAGFAFQDPARTQPAPATPAATPMQKITTALWFPHEAEEAARFYVSAFADGQILAASRWPEGGFRPKGELISATFRIAGMVLIAINGNTQSRFNESVSLLVHCDTQQEIDDYWKKLSVDGKGQCGWTKDKFGVSWQVVPRQLLAMMADKDPAKVKRVGEAMMTMGKIDLAQLQRAFAGA